MRRVSLDTAQSQSQSARVPLRGAPPPVPPPRLAREGVGVGGAPPALLPAGAGAEGGAHELHEPHATLRATMPPPASPYLDAWYGGVKDPPGSQPRIFTTLDARY